MLPQSIPESRIVELENQRTKQPLNDASVQAIAEKRERQRVWLETFSVILSPKMTCERLGVSLGTYQKWRKDPEFCRMYNHALDQFKEELQGAVAVRAMGNRAKDEDGNPLVDADGRPVYEGGSDKLAMAMLGLGQEQTKDVVVSIEIISRREKVIEAEP